MKTNLFAGALILTTTLTTAQEAAPPATPTAQPQITLTPTPPASAETPTAQKIVKPSSKSNTYQDSYVKKDARGMVHLDFVNVEISEIVKSISEVSRKNFIYDEKVRGRITLVSPRPVSVDEAYRAFVSALEVKELTIVKVGNLYKIVPIRDMKSQPIPTNPTTGGYDEFVTRIIPIQHTSADEISKSLRGLVSKNGDLIAYPATNTLILTDSIANIRRIMDIIKRLDQKGFQEGIQVIKLKYAPAVDTAEKITRIFELNGPKTPSIPNPQGMSDTTSKFISKVIPDERTNSIIIVSNIEGFRRVQDLIEQIDRTIIEESGKGRVHVHYLQYADATELAGILSGAASPKNKSANSRGGNNSIFPQATSTQPTPPQPSNVRSAGSPVLSDDTKITADPYTNSLIITASPSDYESLLPVINKLDIRRPQAFVEAMILEVDIDKASSMGTAGNVGGEVGGAKTFAATTFGATSSILLPSDTQSLQGFTAGFQGRTFELPLGGSRSLQVPIYGGFFQALQTNGTVNVLSTPNILTQDNTEAEIVVGQVVPFVTAQGRDVNNQPINQVQRENVAITMRITPQINSSDELTLKIFQENQDLVGGASAALGPTTSKRSAQTTVLVKDGQTITVGGLINDRIQESVSKVPVLGDIPLLGWLFKSKSRSKRKTSLMILITPHIVRYPEDMERISMRKNEERMRFNKLNGMKEHTGLKQYQLDKDLRIPSKIVPAATQQDSPNSQFFETPKTPSVTPQIETTPPAVVEPSSQPIEIPAEAAPAPKEEVKP